MQYEQFVAEVSRRAGTGTVHAEAASQAVVQALAEQTGSDAIAPLAAQLPRELRDAAQAPRAEIVPDPVDGFIERVTELEGIAELEDADELEDTDELESVTELEIVGQPEAERDARAVIAVLKEAITGTQLEELFARLPAGYQELLPEGAHPVKADDFFDRVQRYGHLASRAEAEIAVRLTLSALGDRITQGQAIDLATPLPAEIRPYLKSTSPQPQPFRAEEFLQRISVPQQASPEIARRQVRAVLRALREYVPEREISDTIDQLPSELAALFV
jgi:uncharacterized protein (DUF2267 family)